MTRPKTFHLADLLSIVVEAVPSDREALVCGVRRVTYRQFFERNKPESEQCSNRHRDNIAGFLQMTNLQETAGRAKSPAA